MNEIEPGKVTFRLFKQLPSFGMGIASLIDMSPSSCRYYYDRTEIEADINSLRSDWYVIGGDLYEAIEQYERSRKQTAKV